MPRTTKVQDKKTEDSKINEEQQTKPKTEKILESNDELNSTAKKTTTKAGKRSAKALAQAEEKAVKEAKKQEVAVEEQDRKKSTQKTPRSRVERAGKKYREASKLVEKDKSYNLGESLDLATKTSTVKFDATVELHVNLAVDPKQADQNVRDAVVLPHGSGKSLKVAVFAEGEALNQAKAAGADIVGTDQLIQELDKEQMNFDVLISTPELMARLGKYAKLLGPRGLMPNPKSGTVTTDIAKAVKEAKAGKVEYRVDQAGIIHLGIGKVSFGPQKLLDNAQAILTSIRVAKPSSVKGIYIKSTYVSTTMGPSIKVDL